MVQHVILWKLKDEIPPERRAETRHEVKARLEALTGKIEGMLSIKVNAEPLSTSSADMMLDSRFESKKALEAYQNNPLHLEAAGYVRSVVDVRLCLDFEI